MSDLIKYVILGIPYGCVFALVATGLVLTYKTSGVFNLAFGAQAFLSAAVYYVVRVRHGWPMVPAFVLAVLVVAPLVGLIFDRFLFRHLRSAPEAARLVTSLGLLVAVPQLVLIWLGGADTVGVVGIWSDDNALYHFGRYTIDGRQAAILLSTTVVVLALIAMFRWSPIGLQMRAVVESPRMTQLAGINADRVSAVSWMISSVFAGLAGVLLAPLLGGRLDPNRFTFLLVAAIAAAVFGRLSSIPLTVLGGILLGVVQGLLAGYLPPASLLAQNLRPALPFLVLFLLLIFLPGLRRGRALADPLSGVDPPPPSLAASERSALLTNLTRVLGVIVVIAVLVLALTQFDEYWLGLFTRGLIYSTIFLSITVFTGMAGQISLCQAAFAGVGGFGTAQLVSAYNLPVLTAVVIGALLAAVVGALLAIPVLRLAGIYLSLATLAFGLMFEGVVIPLGWVSGGVRLPDVPRPQIGPINFANDRAVPRAVPRRARDRWRARHPRAPGHHGSISRRAARQPGRVGVDRHQPRAGEDRRARAVGRHRGPRRGIAGIVFRPGAAARLQLLLQPLLDRRRRLLGRTDGRRRDQRRHGPRAVPRSPQVLRVFTDLAVRLLRTRRDHLRASPRRHSRVAETAVTRVRPATDRSARGERKWPGRWEGCDSRAEAAPEPAGAQP